MVSCDSICKVCNDQGATEPCIELSLRHPKSGEGGFVKVNVVTKHYVLVESGPIDVRILHRIGAHDVPGLPNWLLWFYWRATLRVWDFEIRNWKVRLVKYEKDRIGP